MTPSPALLEADSIGRRAPGEGAWLLRDVSLAVAPGERVAVTGPTGAGKTLLLRALALLDEPQEGEIRWRGAPIAAADVPRFRAGAIYLHQRPAIFPGTVAANLRRPLELATHRERSWDEAWIVASLEGVGRDRSFLDRRSADLSGGEAQIVAFLRALQLAPDLLLLDEPTAALDTAAAGEIERLVDRWHADRPGARSLVWVSHDAAQTARTTDRALRIETGRVRS